MAYLLLDKNPSQVSNEVFLKVKSEFSDKNPNFILSSKPFIKLEFLNSLIDSYDIPIIYLDFDLLYTGYVSSGMIKKNNKVRILRFDNTDFENHMKEIIEIISKEQVLVILDSFNVLYNMFRDFDSVRSINSSIMLISSVAKNSKSSIIVTANTIKNEIGEWVLSPSGKHLIDSKNTGMYYLDFFDSSLVLNSINKKLEFEKTFVIKNNLN